MGETAHRVWAEIDTSAVKGNLAAVRNAAAERKVMAVLKADAYGHGAVAMAKLLTDEGVDAIGVGTRAKRWS